MITQLQTRCDKQRMLVRKALNAVQAVTLLVRLFQQLAAEDRKCRLSYAHLKAVLLSLSEAVALEQHDCELPSRLESLQLSDALKCK